MLFRSLTLGRATLVPGARVDRWSIVHDTALSPWLQATLPLGRGLTIKAGTGIYRQAPDTAQVKGTRGSSFLNVEKAAQYDIGVEGRLSRQLRWQATVYDREDRGLLRLPGTEVRLSATNTIINTSTTLPWLNSLDGHSRGIEWLLERHADHGLSGWMSYALGFTRYGDRGTGEHFWGDFDQRHTFNAFGTYRLSDRTSMSARLRLGKIGRAHV